MLHIAIINYSEPAIIIDKFAELDNNATNEEVETFLEGKGYKLSEIHYLTSSEPINLYADSKELALIDGSLSTDEEA